MGDWNQIGPWEDVIPLLPVVTVEGSICWLRRCQRRRLRHWRSRRIIVDYREWPISDIWRYAESPLSSSQGR